MTPKPRTEQQNNVERFVTSLKSLNELDILEIRSVVSGVLSPTPREMCFIGTYRRALANVESILALNHIKHIQAIAAAARCLFELAVDIRLLDLTPQGQVKMLAFIDVEKLRSAQAVVVFRAANPRARIDVAVFERFIGSEQSRITAQRDLLWPGRPDVSHWSLLKMAMRAEKVGQPFDQIYAVEYPRLSWYVHSGLAGVANLSAAALGKMAGIAFTIALKSHVEILRAVSCELKINLADPDIEKKMDYARMLPFTDGPAQQKQLRRELFGLKRKSFGGSFSLGAVGRRSPADNNKYK